MAQQVDSDIPFGTVDNAEAKQMIDSGDYQVIDVRMPNQFAKAHIPEFHLGAVARTLAEDRGSSSPTIRSSLCAKSARAAKWLARSPPPWVWKTSTTSDPASSAGSKTATRSRRASRKRANT